MPGGRPPKPTETKRIAGNPGKRRLNGDEPQFGASGLTCPRWLPDEARREWRRVAPMLREKKVITAADRAALAAYCLSYARWQQAELALEPREVEQTVVGEDGRETKKVVRVGGGLSQVVPLVSKKGEVIGEKEIVRPEVLIAQQYQRLMLAAAGKLGLDPSSRSEVSTIKEEARNPILELLNTRQRDAHTGS